MGNLNFNAADVPPPEPRECIPNGFYHVMIVQSDLKHSEKAGEMVSIAFEVDADEHPQYARRKIFGNYCIHHPTLARTREIARSDLAEICRAIGKAHISDAADLLGGRLIIKVKTAPARDGYDARNEYAGCKAIERAPAAAPRMAPPPAARPAPPAATDGAAQPEQGDVPDLGRDVVRRRAAQEPSLHDLSNLGRGSSRQPLAAPRASWKR